MRRTTRRDFLKESSKGIAALAVTPTVFSRPHQSRAQNSTTGYAYDGRFAGYYQNSAEVPQRVVWINDRITDSGLVDDVAMILPHDDPVTWISNVHDPITHVQSIQSAYSTPNTGYTEPMAEIAELAAAHVLGAVDQVCGGTLKNAFCAIRPPGHHVLDHGFSAGYCVYANVVIAARYAMQHYGIQRVLIIDWDYHHGNSTEDFVCDEPGIMFFETLGSIVYGSSCPSTPAPDSHLTDQTNTTNIYMNCGATNDDFARAWDDHLMTRAQEFKPQLVLISAGFDLKGEDSHGCFAVTANGISRLTLKAMQIADEHAEGRLISMLEGGYCEVGTAGNPPEGQTFYGLSCCAESHLSTLASGVEQEECSFYTGAVMSHGARGRGVSPVSVRGGVVWIDAPRSSVESATIVDATGKTVAHLRPAALAEGRIDMREYIEVAGRYCVRVRFSDGKTRVVSAAVE